LINIKSQINNNNKQNVRKRTRTYLELPLLPLRFDFGAVHPIWLFVHRNIRPDELHGLATSERGSESARLPVPGLRRRSAQGLEALEVDYDATRCRGRLLGWVLGQV
jgi:hypothetical protein